MIVILDVDGVVFRGQFLTHIGRKVSLAQWVRVSCMCALFELGLVSLEKLLRTAYAPWRNRRESDLMTVYRGMPLTPGAAHTVSELRRRGNGVVLVSSGVPEAVVRDLARRLGADCGLGIELCADGGVLTGGVAGALSTTGGKAAAVAELLANLGAGWKDAAAVGDDRNNRDLFERCSLAVGFNPTPALRLWAHRIAQGRDLRLILPHICDDAEEVPAGWRAASELPRKIIHACALLTPLAAARWRPATIGAIMAVSCCYAISELLRRKKKALFPFYWVTALAMRANEEKAAVAPLYLAVAVVVVLLLFEPRASYAAIGAAALSDPAAGLAGSLAPLARLPYSRKKSLAGLLAGCAAGVLGAAIYAPWRVALACGLAAGIAESFLPGDSDNFWPMLAAAMAAMLMG